MCVIRGDICVKLFIADHLHLLCKQTHTLKKVQLYDSSLWLNGLSKPCSDTEEEIIHENCIKDSKKSVSYNLSFILCKIVLQQK